MPPLPKSAKVFVSYAHHDEDLVVPLSGLVGVAIDDSVFVDIKSLKAGDKWRAQLERAIREASVFVLLWCCESSKSADVAHEITLAMADRKKLIVPVLLCSTPLPPELALLQWIDLRRSVVHPLMCGHIKGSDVVLKALTKQELALRSTFSQVELFNVLSLSDGLVLSLLKFAFGRRKAQQEAALRAARAIALHLLNLPER